MRWRSTVSFCLWLCCCMNFPVTIAHELGHYLVASCYGYEPKLLLFFRKGSNAGILGSVDTNLSSMKNFSRRKAICVSAAGLLELVLLVPLFFVNWCFALAFVCFTVWYNVYEVHDAVKEFARVTEVLWFVET